MELTQQSITVVVAVVGAVTGILALGLSVLNYRRDRRDVKVFVERGFLSGPPDEPWDGPYVFVKAVNTGRRPVQLRSGGLLFAGRGNDRLAIMPGRPGSPYALPATLQEAEHVELCVHRDEVIGQLLKRKEHRIPAYGYFDDSAGRQWKTRVPAEVLEELRQTLRSARS
jgi:hypothetical protein